MHSNGGLYIKRIKADTVSKCHEKGFPEQCVGSLGCFFSLLSFYISELLAPPMIGLLTGDTCHGVRREGPPIPAGSRRRRRLSPPLLCYCHFYVTYRVVDSHNESMFTLKGNTFAYNLIWFE